MPLVTLHHVNLVSPEVERLRAFYTEVLGLNELPAMGDGLIRGLYRGDVAFVESGEVQFHLANPDASLGERANEPVNPMARGHIAFRTEALDAVKSRLDEHGVTYSDFGVWGMSGWHQIFFEDPSGTVVEVHQVV